MKAPLGVVLAMIGGIVIGATAINHPNAQSSSGFEKRNFSYNEWTKGKFSEVVTVTNPGKFIFLAGIGPEREGWQDCSRGRFFRAMQIRLHEN